MTGLCGAAYTGALAQEGKANADFARAADQAESPAAKSEPGHGPDATQAAPEVTHVAGDQATGHHDDTDLSHGNASASLSSPAELRYDLSIYSFLVFLILLAVLYKFAWGPIATALQRRARWR